MYACAVHVRVCARACKRERALLVILALSRVCVSRLCACGLRFYTAIWYTVESESNPNPIQTILHNTTQFAEREEERTLR